MSGAALDILSNEKWNHEHHNQQTKMDSEIFWCRIFFNFCQMQLHIFFQMKNDTTNITKSVVKWCRYFFQSRNLIILSDGAWYILLNWKWNYKNSIVLKSRSRNLYFVRLSFRYSSVWKVNLQTLLLTRKIWFANWIYLNNFILT